MVYPRFSLAPLYLLAGGTLPGLQSVEQKLYGGSIRIPLLSGFWSRDALLRFH